MILLLATLITTQLGQLAPPPRPREYRSDGPSRMSRSGQGPSGLPLCDVLSADDKAGAWECMKGDGTMLSGSATTFVPTGTPTNSTEGGFAVRTYTASQNDQQPTAAALPATSFSVCSHHRSATFVAARQFMGFANNGTNAGFAFIGYEIQGAGGNWIAYVSNGSASTGTASVATLSLNTWVFLCTTYQRVGGAADNVLRIYVNGAQVASTSTQRLAQALSSKWSTNGYVDASLGTVRSTRGDFVTYKVLSAADIARIYAGLAL